VLLEGKPLSTWGVARLLHVTPVTVFHWIRAGKLRAYRLPGGHFRVAPSDLQQFLIDNKIPIALHDAAPRRILVVDDEPSVLEAFEAALTLKGYEVVLVPGGRAALRALRRDRFDLIFLDLLLPDLGGSHVLKAIKRRDPEAVVVIVTGYPNHDEAIAALEYGPAMMLPKPVKLSDIEAVLRIVFKGRDPVPVSGDARRAEGRTW
jgi:excisionase family DNA binding protein